MDRPFPKQYAHYLKIANDHNMTFPRGRALYVCNRIANGDWWYLSDPRRIETWKHVPHIVTPENIAEDMKRCIEAMKKIRISTAQRWYEHWNNGGHIKSIKRSQEEQNKFHRDSEANRKKLYGKGSIYKKEIR